MLTLCVRSAGRFGGPAVVQLGDQPEPVLGDPREVLVQVHAVALNPVRTGDAQKLPDGAPWVTLWLLMALRSTTSVDRARSSTFYTTKGERKPQQSEGAGLRVFNQALSCML